MDSPWINGLYVVGAISILIQVYDDAKTNGAKGWPGRLFWMTLAYMATVSAFM